MHKSLNGMDIKKWVIFVTQVTSNNNNNTSSAKAKQFKIGMIPFY